jgi:hypothetical protein
MGIREAMANVMPKGKGKKKPMPKGKGKGKPVPKGKMPMPPARGVQMDPRMMAAMRQRAEQQGMEEEGMPIPRRGR